MDIELELKIACYRGARFCSNRKFLASSEMRPNRISSQSKPC
jgi:hypothetical protein